MKTNAKVYCFASLTIAAGAACLVKAQELPCWKTFTTGWTACQVWEANHAPPDFCSEGADWETSMVVYYANRAAKGWTSYQAALFECSGTYFTGQECDQPNTLNWQIAGTQASGDSCPSGPPQ